VLVLGVRALQRRLMRVRVRDGRVVRLLVGAVCWAGVRVDVWIPSLLESRVSFASLHIKSAVVMRAMRVAGGGQCGQTHLWGVLGVVTRRVPS
jgi:hypothetical protein